MYIVPLRRFRIIACKKGGSLLINFGFKQTRRPLRYEGSSFFRRPPLSEVSLDPLVGSLGKRIEQTCYGTGKARAGICGENSLPWPFNNSI